jgi:hypothetical protein
MKEKVPLRVYYRVAILFFFTSIMIWYFSFRVLCMVFPFPTYFTELFYISIFFSIAVCLSLVKRGIRDEMKNKDQTFSLVARDPKVEIKKEKITKKIVINRIIASIFISFILTLPVTTIGALQVINKKYNIIEIFGFFKAGYWKLYLGCFLLILFFSFFQRYLLDRWQWTKHQF